MIGFITTNSIRICLDHCYLCESKGGSKAGISVVVNAGPESLF